MKKHIKNIGFYALLFAVFMVVLSVLTAGPTVDTINYSEFVNSFKSGEIRSMNYHLGENLIEGVRKVNGHETRFEVVIPSLETLEKERATLKANIAHAQMQRPVYTKDQIVRWMSRFKGGDISEPTYRKQIIDIFLNSIYVYDDKLVFTYNFKDGTETISLAEVEAALCSDLTCLAPPNKKDHPNGWSFLFAMA